MPVDPRDESHKDPEYIDFSAPRLARYLHTTWKRHQDEVFWVDIDLSIKEGLTFCQTRLNAIVLQGTLPAHCDLKVERLKTGEKLCERQYLSPRPPPKISLKHDHNWTRGNDQFRSTVDQQPEGKVVRQSRRSSTCNVLPTNPTNPKEKPEDTQGVFVVRDCWGKPVKDEDNRVMSDHDRTGKPWKKARTKCKKLVLSNIVMLHR